MNDISDDGRPESESSRAIGTTLDGLYNYNLRTAIVPVQVVRWHAREGPPNLSASAKASLLTRIRQAGGTLEIPCGTIIAKDLAVAASDSGNEIALYRDLATGKRFAKELGPAGGEIPIDSRLIVHVQPGDGPLSVIPSAIDREALAVLGQKSSVIVNAAGTYAMRFGQTCMSDNPIRPIRR